MHAVSKLPIKTWAESDRPREKLLGKGRQALSDAELIAILIGSGNKKESAVELARRILSSAENHLDKLSKFDINELREFAGIGDAKAVTIMAALELGRRRLGTCTENDTLRIRASSDAHRIIRTELDDLSHEEFWVLLTNRSNLVIRKEQISRGGVNATIVDPKMIFKTAMSYGACGIVLCHNHPSGAVNPSEQDIRLTRKIKEGSQLLDIALLDHIIVGANIYFSFADDGLI